MAPATKNHIIWTVALYAGAALAGLATLGGFRSSGGAWVPLLLLAPMMALLLPPVRAAIDPAERYLPSPKWSLWIALGLALFQGFLFNDHRAEIQAKQAAAQEQQAAQRATDARRALTDEYADGKNQILARIEVLQGADELSEAKQLVDKYAAVTKDPDLARLKRRNELLLMKRELSDEKALSLDRRAAIYQALIREMPGSLALYQDKLKEVNAALEARRQVQAAAAKKAAAEERIRSQFSGWDGSHRNVEREVKARMKNPRSYEHVETRYQVGQDVIVITTLYRGTNGFGAVVTSRAIATVDMDGNVLTLSQ